MVTHRDLSRRWLALDGKRFKPLVLSYTTTSANETATIKYSWSGGGTSTIDWGDGTGEATLTSGSLASHTYSTPGTYVAKISEKTYESVTKIENCSTNGGFSGPLARLPAGISYVNVPSTISTITGSVTDLPAGMSWLTLYGTSSAITGSLADLPPGMSTLHLASTNSVITGSLSDLPSKMNQLNMQHTSSIVTGSLSDLPASLCCIYLGDTKSNISGGASAMVDVGVARIYAYSYETQANLDDILKRLYTDRMSFTSSTPSINISGNNPPPSGVYQNSTTPSTGLEYAYKLANDPDNEGFHTWGITWNGGTAP